MSLKTMSLVTLLGRIITGPVLAADPGQAIENHLDRRGDHIRNRMEHRH